LTIDENIIGFVERRIGNGTGWDEGDVCGVKQQKLDKLGFEQATLQVQA
jgi:hypothetical protein